MLYLFFHFTATAPKLSAESSVKLSIAELESGKSGPDKTSRTGNGPSQYILHCIHVEMEQIVQEQISLFASIKQT